MDLVRLALDRGAVAASAFGAGFGGSVWAAFRDGDDQADQWLEAYCRRHPEPGTRASLHRVRPGPCITPLHDAEAADVALCRDGAA